METGIPHQFLADLSPEMLNATVEYMVWRNDERERAQKRGR